MALAQVVGCIAGEGLCATHRNSVTSFSSLGMLDCFFIQMGSLFEGIMGTSPTTASLQDVL